MRHLIKYFAVHILIIAVVQDIKASTGVMDLEANNEYDSVVTMALFDKLNWIVKEIKNFNERFREFRRKLHIRETLTRSNLHALKAEIHELLQQQDLKTETLVWQTKQQVMENSELQESFLKNITESLENLKSYDVVPLKHYRNWQTILRRQDGSENFNRSWNEYKTGFGQVNGEFFIGLEKLHAMTTYGDPQELLIILQDFDNQTRYARYSNFVVDSENEDYKIKEIGEYQGDADDSLSHHLNCRFSTYDRDTDNSTLLNCAKVYEGGWWFSACYSSHLTGSYLRQPKIVQETGNGLVWYSWHGLKYSLKYAEMLIRPK